MVEAVWVLPTPRIEPKDLLIKIPMQVKRFNTHIRAFDGSLEQRPKFSIRFVVT